MNRTKLIMKLNTLSTVRIVFRGIMAFGSGSLIGHHHWIAGIILAICLIAFIVFEVKYLDK